MDSSEITSFALAAPTIAGLMSQLKAVYPGKMPPKIIPMLTLAMAFAWGAVLVYSDLLHTNMASFILTAVTVSAAANGVQSVFRTYEPSAEEVATKEHLEHGVPFTVENADSAAANPDIQFAVENQMSDQLRGVAATTTSARSTTQQLTTAANTDDAQPPQCRL